MDPQFNDFDEVSFVRIGGSEVCLIEVEHATETAFLDHEGDQKLYRRQGNRTIPLEPKELQHYISQHFSAD